MKQRALIFLLSCCCTSLSLLSQPNSKGTLEIHFTGLRSDRGMVAIGISTLPEGWPRKPQIELHWKKTNIVDGTLAVRVPDLPFGTLAISVLDDENSNLEMDMTLGIPREGYGFSRDAPLRMGPPSFEACAFQFERANQKISITMKYMAKGK